MAHAHCHHQCSHEAYGQHNGPLALGRPLKQDPTKGQRQQHDTGQGASGQGESSPNQSKKTELFAGTYLGIPAHGEGSKQRQPDVRHPWRPFPSLQWVTLEPLEAAPCQRSRHGEHRAAHDPPTGGLSIICSQWTHMP